MNQYPPPPPAGGWGQPTGYQQPAPYGAYGPQMAPVAPAPMWRCPYCGYQGPPSTKSRVRGAGWVVFVVLLIFCFPLCWLGLLMTEKQTLCSSCGTAAGGAT